MPYADMLERAVAAHRYDASAGLDPRGERP